MLQLYNFLNDSGDFGVFQKNGDIVCYFIESSNPLYSPSGCNSWSTWVNSVESGYSSGCKEKISKESIKFFLNSIAESISLNIVDIAEVKNPGSFYPRIARRSIGFNISSNNFLQDIRAYKNIQSRLDELFDYIEPNLNNLNCFGHKIRELLILACTEVECLLVNALTENGYKDKKTYATCDYFNLKDILKLNSYETYLVNHPDIESFQPFAEWDSANTTKSIPWYSAYNAVKHNRSLNIQDANFRNLLNSISAIHILLEAQYGGHIFDRFRGINNNQSIFKTKRFPEWGCKDLDSPILIEGYSVRTRWGESRKYFEDYPLILKRPANKSK